jgi:hypothetical protein
MTVGAHQSALRVSHMTVAAIGNATRTTISKKRPYARYIRGEGALAHVLQRNST